MSQVAELLKRAQENSRIDAEEYPEEAVDKKYWELADAFLKKNQIFGGATIKL